MYRRYFASGSEEMNTSSQAASVMDAVRKARVSSLQSRNVTVGGRRTSVRLEPDMWSATMDICRRERINVHDLCSAIQKHKSPKTSLTAAIRVFIMAYFRVAATDAGHEMAGHGRGLPVENTVNLLQQLALQKK